MKHLVILVMISYFIQLTVNHGPELSVLQYPQDVNVSLDSTILILCIFDCSDKPTDDIEVYWRKGPNCSQFGLKSSTITSPFQKSQVTITTEVSKSFSILQLDKVQLDDSDMYFCDVYLTDPPPVRRKCGSGSRLTVHEYKGSSSSRSGIRPDETWWVWFILLGCSISVSIIITAFCTLQCCKRYRNNSKNTNGVSILLCEWIYDKPSRVVNNGFNQEYEDMTLMRTFTQSGSNI